MNAPPVSIIEAIHDDNLFRPFFKNLSTWSTWFVVLKSLFALPLTPEELEIFRELTGREHPPSTPATEAWLICGRRAGKSFIVALIAVYLACFKDYRPYLAPGERATIQVIATDRKQSRTIFRYVVALITQVPMLAAMVDRQDSDSIDLTNGVSIEITTCSFRSVRGYTVARRLVR